MDKFNITPIGDVKITYDWGSEEITFESSVKQYKRRRIHAKKTYAFTVSGIDLPALVKFYNDQRGQEKPFYFTYDGITEICYFGAPINPKCKRENGMVMGYSCDIILEVEKQEHDYPAPNEHDVLPLPHGDTEEKLDWNTHIVSLGVLTRRGNRTQTPVRTVSCTWCGLKEDRDKIIELFNSHGRIPLELRYDGGRYKVILPGKLEITDHRELKTIVGFECQMDVQVIKQC